MKRKKIGKTGNVLEVQLNTLKRQLDEYDEEEGEEEEEESQLDPKSIQAVKQAYQKRLKSRKTVKELFNFF